MSEIDRRVMTVSWFFLTGLIVRQGETEFRAAIDGSGCPDASAVTLDDSLDGGEADACTGKLRLRMEALEGLEEACRIRGIEACAVVADEED